MVCIGIEIKERREKEKEKHTSRRKKWEMPLCTAHRRRVTASENLKRVKGKFLRKSKGKISQKGEKRKRKMEKF